MAINSEFVQVASIIAIIIASFITIYTLCFVCSTCKKSRNRIHVINTRIGNNTLINVGPNAHN
jgi:hypothetical protein